MDKMKIRWILLAGVFMPAISCTMDEWDRPDTDRNTPKIELGGEIEQVYQTRASDSGFADGDKIGIYVVDWDGTMAPMLASRGNRADNLRFTFDEASWKWIPDHDLYWRPVHSRNGRETRRL